MVDALVVITCSLGAPWESRFVQAAAHPALAVHVVSRCGDPGEALGIAMRDRPFAVVAESVAGWWDRDIVARLAQCGTALVVVGGDGPPGATSCDGETPEAIAGALLRLDARGEPAEPTDSAEPAPQGELIAVWGGAGSPGRTTAAIHLAAASAACRGDVLLIDADVWAPSVAQRLDLDDRRGLVHAVRSASLGAEPLDGTVTARGSLDVVPGMARPDLWPEIAEHAFDAVITAALARYRQVVVDLAAPIEEDEGLSFDRVPFRRNLTTRAVLGRAERILLIVAADPIGVRRGLQAFEALRAELPACVERVDLVVNRVPPGRGDEVAAVLHERTGRPVVACVPGDRSADAASWRGCLTSEVARRSPIWSSAVRIVAGWAA